MPYTMSNPPTAIKLLPAGAKKIFIGAVNSALAQKKTEESAFRIAWAAVKNKYTRKGETWTLRADSEPMFDMELPLEVKTMPAGARSIFRAAFNKARKEERDDLAAVLALSAVKKKFEMEGEEWVKKKAEPPKNGEDDDDHDEDEDDDDDDEDEDEDGRKRAPVREPSKEPRREAGSEPEYSKTTKTTETTETKRGGGEGGETTGDSAMEVQELFTLDATGFRLTGDGYLVTEPRVARTGIQIYKGYEVGRPDMEDVRVYRPEDEVFSKQAMASLAHRTITLDHPFTKVDSSNWKELTVGHSSEPVARDGDFVRVPLVLMDAHAITAAQSGKSQLSVGYGAKLKWEAGQTPDGQLYDAMQQDIRANHIALVTSARGGDRLKIGDQSDLLWLAGCEDGGDEYFDREFSTKQRKAAAEKGQAMPHGGFPIKSEKDLRNAIQAIGRAKNPGAAKAHIKKRAAALGLTKLIPKGWGDSEGNHRDQQRSSKMSDRMLTIDGVNIAVEDKDGQILERHLKQLNDTTADVRKQLTDAQTQIGTLTAQAADLSKTVATKDGEIAALNKKVEDGKVTPQMLDEFCRKRMDVVGRAVRVLGDNYAFETKSDSQIRRDVVAADMTEAAIKDWADEKIEGAFNYMTKPQTQDGNQRLALSFSRPVGGASNSNNDAAATAYNKRNDDLQNAYKKNKRAFGGAPAV